MSKQQSNPPQNYDELHAAIAADPALQAALAAVAEQPAEWHVQTKARLLRAASVGCRFPSVYASPRERDTALAFYLYTTPLQRQGGA